MRKSLADRHNFYTSSNWSWLRVPHPAVLKAGGGVLTWERRWRRRGVTGEHLRVTEWNWADQVSQVRRIDMMEVWRLKIEFFLTSVVDRYENDGREKFCLVLWDCLCLFRGEGRSWQGRREEKEKVRREKLKKRGLRRRIRKKRPQYQFWVCNKLIYYFGLALLRTVSPSACLQLNVSSLLLSFPYIVVYHS